MTSFIEEIYPVLCAECFEAIKRLPYSDSYYYEFTYRDLEHVVQEADDAFWEVIAKFFKHGIKSGDFPPDLTIQREINNMRDVMEWIVGNAPQDTGRR